MSKPTKPNVSFLQSCLLVMSLALVVAGSLIAMQGAFIFGGMLVIGGIGWLFCYVLTNPTIRKKLFHNLFDDE